MKKVVKVFFFIALIFTAGFAAQAQSKIGYVDSNEVMQAMPERSTAEAALIEFNKQLESELMTMATEYQSKLGDYQNNLATMSNLIRQSKEKELTDLQTRIQAFQESAEYEFSEKQNELLAPIIEKIKGAIETVGKENNFTYVIDKATGVLLYIGADAEDITPKVKTKLGIK